MMWRARYESNTELVHGLERHRHLKTARVTQMFLAVDRKDFVPRDHVDWSYVDAPLPIGWDATISAPHMHAIATECLESKLVPGARVLDVGSGSGYLTLIFALLCDILNNKDTHVVGIDSIKALIEQSKRNVSKSWQNVMDCDRFLLVEGDGWVGHPAFGPFDVIHVGAAAAHLPKALFEQLAVNGVMTLPYGSFTTVELKVTRVSLTDDVHPHEKTCQPYDHLVIIDKSEDEFFGASHIHGTRILLKYTNVGVYLVENHGDVSFVPLVEQRTRRSQTIT